MNTPLPSISAVLFDLDGTLVDTNEFHVLAWRQAFAEAGHNFPVEVIRRQIGKGADQLIPTLLPGENDERGEGKRVADRHGELFRTLYLPQVRPFPDAGVLVRELAAAGIRVVLASSANREEVEHYTKLLGIEESIAASTSADDVAHTKPAGDIFAAALGKVPDIDPSQVVVVGDTPYDVIAANRCGLATLALLSGGFDERWLRDSGAAAVYAGAAALLARFRASGQLAG